jgi:hypothetical protein
MDVGNVRNGGRSVAAVLVRKQGRSAGSRYRPGMRSAWPRNSARFRDRTHCRRLCLGLHGLVRAFLRGPTATNPQSRLTGPPDYGSVKRNSPPPERACDRGRFFGSAPPEIKQVQAQARRGDQLQSKRAVVASIGIEVFPPQRRRTGAIVET